MNRQNTLKQMTKLASSRIRQLEREFKNPPPKFVSAPRPAHVPNRAPKPAPRLPWRLRNLLSLLKMAVKLALVRIARWRSVVKATVEVKPVRMNAAQRRRERRAALVIGGTI